MIKICLHVLILLVVVSCNKPTETQNPKLHNYDSTLAKQLGADKNGMKNYSLCFLNPGPPKMLETVEYKKINKQHFQYLSELSKRGDIVLAGMFPQLKEHAELLVFKVNEEKARELMAKDPKIKSGILTMQFTQFYSSAALPELAKLHRSIVPNKQTNSGKQ